MNLVEITHLTKQYPGFTLDDVSFAVPAGYVTGFVGANGSGKTTTIKCALGLVHPTSGTTQCLPHERIGVVFDTPPYHGEWRVGDVERTLRRFYPVWRDEIFADHLHRAAIDPNKKIKDLSRGMGMRLQMAAALAHQPDLLILDEPTSGLDPLGRSELIDELAEFITDESHAIWFSTHITTDLDRLADHLVVLDRGRVFASGLADEVLADFAVVRGAPAQLSPLLRQAVIGLRETPSGWEGLLPTDRAELLTPGVLTEQPNIEQLAVAVAKGNRS